MNADELLAKLEETKTNELSNRISALENRILVVED